MNIYTKIVFLVPSLLLSQPLYYMQNHQKIYLNKIQKQSRSNEIYYHTSNGNELILKRPELLVAFKSSSFLDLDIYKKKYNIQKIKKIDSLRYIISVDSEESLFQLLEKLNQETNVIYATPNFIQKLQRR